MASTDLMLTAQELADWLMLPLDQVKAALKGTNDYAYAQNGEVKAAFKLVQALRAIDSYYRSNGQKLRIPSGLPAAGISFDDFRPDRRPAVHIARPSTDKLKVSPRKGILNLLYQHHGLLYSPKWDLIQVLAGALGYNPSTIHQRIRLLKEDELIRVQARHAKGTKRIIATRKLRQLWQQEPPTSP